jgi:L-alanine-DL-glutamate epimerase-like enolase superfamily enzyme
MYKLHTDFKPHIPVTFNQLQEIMDHPVLQTEKLPDPVIIDSFAMFLCNGDWFLRVRGRNGEEGIAPCSERASYLHLLLKERILPLMLGRDARELEKLFSEIFVWDINYKIQGLAWWCCIAWVESAVLDMLAKAAGVNVTGLLGGRCRNELELYVASGNRNTTPEEEVAFLEEKIAKMLSGKG